MKDMAFPRCFDVKIHSNGETIKKINNPVCYWKKVGTELA